MNVEIPGLVPNIFDDSYCFKFDIWNKYYLSNIYKTHHFLSITLKFYKIFTIQ